MIIITLTVSLTTKILGLFTAMITIFRKTLHSFVVIYVFTPTARIKFVYTGFTIFVVIIAWIVSIFVHFMVIISCIIVLMLFSACMIVMTAMSSFR
eukprot:UN00011